LDTRFTTPIYGGSTDVTLVGGKSAGLTRLATLGLTVPEGFTVTTAAYRETLSGVVRGADNAELLRRRILDAEFPAAVRAAIVNAHDALVRRVGPHLVVRSSSTHEDGRTTSFAGQAATFLDVNGQGELFEYIRRCWASLFRESGLLYGPRGRSDGVPPEMAVVVQARVRADSAGVLFTTNPLSGDTGESLVCSSFGLGEGVVAGRDADTYAVDRRTGKVRTRHLAEKRQSLVVGTSGKLVHVDLPPLRAAADSLSERELATLVDAGTRIEAALGTPQDIEWAFTDGRLTFLQARPITAGRGLSAMGGRPGNGKNGGNGRTLWCNVNVGEALPGVGTPMTWSILRAFSRRGFEEAFAALGLAVPEEYELVGNFRGRVYLNLTEFLSVASQIPFFPPERLLTLGGGGGLEGVKDTYVPRNPLAFMLRLPLTLPRMALSQALLPGVARLWSWWFHRYRERFYALALDTLSPQALLDVLASLTAVFNRTGTIMLAGASNALSSYIAVLAMVQRWSEIAEDSPHKRLFVGLSSVSSAAPGLHLLQIARAARRHPEWAQALAAHDPAEESFAAFQARLRADPRTAPLAHQLDTFLAAHGHRAAREAELSTPRWSEDPTFLLTVLKAHLVSAELPDPDTGLAELAAVRFEATRAVRASLAPPLGAVFALALRVAQEAARRRESMRSEVVHTLAMYRHLIREVGGRLARATLIAEPDDVFFLSLEELRQWLAAEAAGAPPPFPVALRVAARRAEYEAFCEAPDPPDTFTFSAGEIVAEALPEEATQAPVLRGLPGSPGRRTGTARVLHGPSDGSRLRPGDILVAPYTDVGWTPLFLVAGAVIMEMGGALSHSCVVAREYGIPAVVNLKHATTRIRDGQEVTVDGDAGVVYLHGETSA
jgi:rifampicin phosphotransferase